MEAEIGRRVADFMLVIFGVMPAIKGEEASAIIGVKIADKFRALILGKDRYIFLDVLFMEHCRLSHEAFDDIDVILRQHRRNGIEFGTEIIEREVVIFLRTDL